MGDIEEKRPTGESGERDAGSGDAASSGQAVPAAADVPSGDGDVRGGAAGAYVLDALSDEERSAFASFLAASPETQAEVRELASVVAVLPRLLTLDAVVLRGDADAGAEVPAPSPALRDRIMAAARAEPAALPVAEAATAAVDDDHGSPGQPPMEPSSAAPAAFEQAWPRPLHRTDRTEAGALSVRPQGRIRAGTPLEADADAPTPIRSLSRLPRPWLAAAAMTLVSVGAIVWALALLGQTHDRAREIRAQATEIAQIRQDANATAFTMSATADGPNAANGTFFFSSRQPQAVLLVQGLKPPAQGRVYQLWYLNGATAPNPGGTFDIDQNGNGFVVMASGPGSFTGVALTQEPAGGSTTPTLPILMQGAAATTAG